MPSTPMYTTCGPSSVTPAAGSRRSAASATGWPMPEDTEPVESSDADARLIRSVRWRLVAWSGGTTLLVLIVLAVTLYASVANSLAYTGVSQPNTPTGD